MSPNDFGKKYLTEQCKKLKISDFMRQSNKRLKEMLLQSYFEAEGCNIVLKSSNTGFGGVRLWFSCPNCNRRVGVLYKYPTGQILGCRCCLRLDYRKHRYNKMA